MFFISHYFCFTFVSLTLLIVTRHLKSFKIIFRLKKLLFIKVTQYHY